MTPEEWGDPYEGPRDTSPFWEDTSPDLSPLVIGLVIPIVCICAMGEAIFKYIKRAVKG